MSLTPSIASQVVSRAMAAVSTGLSLWTGETTQEQVFNDDGTDPLVRQLSLGSDRTLAIDANYSVTDTIYHALLVVEEKPLVSSKFWISRDDGDTLEPVEFISYEQKTGYVLFRFRKVG